MLRSGRAFDEGPFRCSFSYLRLVVAVVALLIFLTLLTWWLTHSSDAPPEPVPGGRPADRSDAPLPSTSICPPSSSATREREPEALSPPVAPPTDLVASAFIEGSVRDERGVAVEEGVVRLFGAEGDVAAPIGPDGRYRLEGERGALGFLQAEVPDHVTPPSLATVAFPDAGALQHDIEVLRVWVVAGRLVTPEGRPVARARLEIENAPFGLPITDNAGPGADGAFRHRMSPPIRMAEMRLPFAPPASEPPGPLALRVVPEDGRVDVVVPLDGETLRAEAFLDVGDVVIPRGLELEGSVRESDGTPIAAAALTIQLRAASALFRAATSDEAGAFRFEGLEPGSYVLFARSERHVTTIVSDIGVVAPPAAAPDLDVVMERGVAIEGVVIDERGDPVAGARVRVDAVAALAAAGGGGGGGTSETKSTVTKEDGSFRVEGLAPDFRERHARLVERRAATGGRPAPPAPFVVRVRADGVPPLAGEATGVTPNEPVTIVVRPGGR